MLLILPRGRGLQAALFVPESCVNLRVFSVCPDGVGMADSEGHDDGAGRPFWGI